MSRAEREERSDYEEAYRLEDNEDYKVLMCLMKNGKTLNANMNRGYFMVRDQPLIVKYISNDIVWASHNIVSYFQAKGKMESINSILRKPERLREKKDPNR